MLKIGWLFMPADNINNFVMNIPNGGIPVTVKNPAKNKTLVYGRAVNKPLMLAIFVELNFKNIVPADKNKADFVRE